MREKKKKTQTYVIILIAVITLGSIAFLVWSPYSPWSYWWVEEETTTPTVKTKSTFNTISHPDGEIVSPFVEMDIWTPKSGATFTDGYEDITALTTNFERKETGKDADDISIDLIPYDYIWAEITGNTVYENTFYLLIGGINRDYNIYVHQSSSDVNFNILDATLNEVFNAGYQTNSNFTAILDAPHYTTTNCHYGDIGWELTATEFNEMTEAQKEIVWDEAKWRDQYPTYDPTLDTLNDFERDFEIITNAPALKFTFNTTIDVTDGSDTEVNCTIGKGYPIEYFISGTDLYMVWYEGFDFDPEPYIFEFEMWFAINISVSTVISGRVDVPASISSVSWAETYSTIGL